MFSGTLPMTKRGYDAGCGVWTMFSCKHDHDDGGDCNDDDDDDVDDDNDDDGGDDDDTITFIMRIMIQLHLSLHSFLSLYIFFSYHNNNNNNNNSIIIMVS